jgi:hypothetical protein
MKRSVIKRLQLYRTRKTHQRVAWTNSLVHNLLKNGRVIPPPRNLYCFQACSALVLVLNAGSSQCVLERDYRTVSA